ncbi:MAG TPA: hypothetical protein VK543_10065 [Puia sp.]|nr:hypothetical protein [Puia sp.]
MKKNYSFVIANRFALFIFFVWVFSACTKSPPEDKDLGLYDIDVKLQPENVKDHGFGGFGFVKFRQNPDTARIITLDTWVFALKPNHAYLLQRAANPIADITCTNTAWLTLGKGLVPQSIETDSKGNGQENLFRDITGVARGMTFHIAFQIVDAETLTTVLSSDCYQYTVR